MTIKYLELKKVTAMHGDEIREAVSNVVDGFATALMHMHPGDHWMVYIPYQLGYGTTGNGSIPAYSMLRFEIALDSYHSK